MNLQEKLKSLDRYPFHIPGHKRNEKFNITGSEIDITEIDGFDNLHNPQEILRELEERYARLYKAERSILSVNGSTACLLAAISALCRCGDEIIIARNCHKSVYNACFLNRLRVHYIVPEYDIENEVFTRVTQKQIDEAVKEHPNARAIVITSPTYEGAVSRIKSPVPLIIDAAHGAHFGFSEKFCDFQTADIIVCSLHKTLPALTSSAIVNVYNGDYADRVKMYMDIYETSSPSYIILAGIEKCADFLENPCDMFDVLYEMLSDFIKDTKALKSINVFTFDDISRLNISCCNMNGYELAQAFRSDYKIEVEMACKNYVTLVTSVGDTREGFERLYLALNDLDGKCAENCTPPAREPYSLPVQSVLSWQVEKTVPCDIKSCNGKVCGEYIYTYPPGIPIIVPGEIIDDSIISRLRGSNTKYISDSNLLPNKILTKL